MVSISRLEGEIQDKETTSIPIPLNRKMGIGMSVLLNLGGKYFEENNYLFIFDLNKYKFTCVIPECSARMGKLISPTAQAAKPITSGKIPPCYLLMGSTFNNLQTAYTRTKAEKNSSPALMVYLA